MSNIISAAKAQELNSKYEYPIYKTLEDWFEHLHKYTFIFNFCNAYAFFDKSVDVDSIEAQLVELGYTVHISEDSDMPGHPFIEISW